MSSQKTDSQKTDSQKADGAKHENQQKDSSSAQKQFLDEDSLKIYPERRGTEMRYTWAQQMFYRPDASKITCEKKCSQVVETSPLVKLMMSALKSAGCEVDIRRHISCDYHKVDDECIKMFRSARIDLIFADKKHIFICFDSEVDIRRHISCEYCSEEVTGGYDPELNQVVICHNRVWNKALIQGVLAHEFLHMFDYCRAKFDFKNVEHVACSEIRAANLMHCSLMSSMFLGTSYPWNFRQTHKNCVKTKAVASILAVRKDMPTEEAWAIVDKVFDKCYNDLEPVGRRLRRASNHMKWAYRERFHYDYD